MLEGEGRRSVSKSATRYNAESCPTDPGMWKIRSKQTRDKPRGAPKAARCPAQGAFPRKACSDAECSTCHDISDLRQGRQFCRQRSYSSHLLCHSARLLLDLLLLPRTLLPISACSIPFLSAPIVRTSAPWTTLAWTKTTLPEETLLKPKPLSTNHSST